MRIRDHHKQFVQDTGYPTSAETNDKGCVIWNKERGGHQLGVSWKNPGFKQTDHHPVVCVSWQDAKRYAAWLSKRTAAKYRLPTEAEWEYAARSGTQTAYFYQADKQCNYANGLGQEGKIIAAENWTLADCSDGFIYTAPVASFADNHFGLFDMLGNVFEWTQDCWHGDYQGAPQDGAAWLRIYGGDCDRRVVRGGSWVNDPRILRSAYRIWYFTDVAYFDLGFRVARDL